MRAAGAEMAYMTCVHDNFTLHGRAGNTPASKVEIEIADKAPFEITVRGGLPEYFLKQKGRGHER